MLEVVLWLAFCTFVAALVLGPVFGGAAWLMWLDVRAAKRRDARDRGVCPKCGYDLRATPDRCPECGTRTA